MKLTPATIKNGYSDFRRTHGFIPNQLYVGVEELHQMQEWDGEEDMETFRLLLGCKIYSLGGIVMQFEVLDDHGHPKSYLGMSRWIKGEGYHWEPNKGVVDFV